MPSPTISKTSLANLALQALGRGKEISNLTTDKSEEAGAVRRVYDHALDLVLREWDWPFARRTATLALVEENPNDRWAYSYRVPSDCIYARKIWSQLRRDNEYTKIKFEISGDASGWLLFTDEAEAILVYTSRVTTTSHFPNEFVEAFSLRLAYQAAPRIMRGKRTLRRQLMAEYQAAIGKARAVSGNEESIDQEPEASWISDRD